MVARPSLKRAVPGSVPPWRALCAESARALKAFSSVLCVSKSVLLLESKIGQILRAINLRVFWVRPSCPHAGRGRGGAPPQLLWPSGRASTGGWSRARFLLSARVFRGPVVVSGCRNFHFRQSRRGGSLSSSLRSAELLSWRGVAAKRELEIIAKPLGLLREALLSGRSFLRTETRSFSLPLQRVSCRLPISSPIFAVRHLLRRSRCARAAFDLLSCAGVEADSW